MKVKYVTPILRSNIVGFLENGKLIFYLTLELISMLAFGWYGHEAPPDMVLRGRTGLDLR